MADFSPALPNELALVSNVYVTAGLACGQRVRLNLSTPFTSYQPQQPAWPTARMSACRFRAIRMRN